MMAIDGHIAEDTLFEPERLRARAIDWDQGDRGLSSGRAAPVLQSRRRIHGRNRHHASINRKYLALREPSIHGSSPMGDGELTALAERGSRRLEFILAVPARRYAELVNTFRGLAFDEEGLAESSFAGHRLIVAQTPLRADEQTARRRARIAELEAMAEKMVAKLDAQDEGKTARGPCREAKLQRTERNHPGATPPLRQPRPAKTGLTPPVLSHFRPSRLSLINRLADFLSESGIKRPARRDRHVWQPFRLGIAGFGNGPIVTACPAAV
jgi:hypothetical protein